MTKILSCLVATLLSGLLFWVSPTPAQTLKTGYTSKTIFFLPFFVAQKKGFYQAEDIKVELIQMGTPAVSLQALIAGQIQICNINPDGIIIAGEKGANLKAIAGVVNGVAYTLVGGKPYKKLEDIKGTRLGVGSLKGGPTTFLLEYLRAKGLSYPRDYSLVLVAGGTPARLAALESGAVSAAVLGVPQSDMALDRGFNRLGDVHETLPSFQFTTVNVNFELGGEKPLRGGQVYQGTHPQPGLDSRASGRSCGIPEPGVGHQAALLPHGFGLFS